MNVNLNLTPMEVAVTVAGLTAHRQVLVDEPPLPDEHASARAMGLVTLDNVLTKCEAALREAVQ